jgi:adenylate cyclase
MVTHMDDLRADAITPLLRDAEHEAELTTAWVRIALALALAGSLLISGRIAAVAGDLDILRQLGLAGLAVGALLALGVASLLLVRTRRYAPWMAFAFTAGDAAIILLLGSPRSRRSGPRPSSSPLGPSAIVRAFNCGPQVCW